MKTSNQEYAGHPLIFMLKNFLGKLVQTRESYPIKYYKNKYRSKNTRNRNW